MRLWIVNQEDDMKFVGTHLVRKEKARTSANDTHVIGRLKQRLRNAMVVGPSTHGLIVIVVWEITIQVSMLILHHP